jgi:spermidine/putrescine transport system substrate-binding protein
MKKSATILLALTTAAALMLTACSGSSNSSTKASGSSGDTGEKTLVVANWKGYGSDADYGAPAFEKLYNCKVVHQYFTSEDEMLTMLQTGGMGKIDVILPNSTYIKTAYDEGLIQPIDTSKLTNYKNLNDTWKNFSDANIDGKTYAVPWTWGTTSLGYNPDIVKDKITSWSSLWDPKYAGKIGFFDDYETAIMTTALYLKEPDPMKPDLDKVKDSLLQLKKNTKVLWSSYDDYLKPYAANEIAIGNMWTGTATQLTKAKHSVAYITPDEGTIGWGDFWSIAKNAPDYDLALKWVDFMTGEQFQTAFATGDNAHCPVNNLVTDKLTTDQKKDLWIYPSTPSKIYIEQALDTQTRQAWLNVWNTIKAS